MAINLSEFVKEILSDVIGCPDFVIKRAIRKSIEEFCEKTWVLFKEFNYEITEGDVDDTTLNEAITIDMSTYSSGAFPVAVTNLMLDGFPCYAEERKLDSLIPDFDSIEKSDTKYFYFSDSNTCVMFPFEDEDANLFMRLVLKPLPTVTEVADFFYYDWLDPIVAGAKARLQMMADKKWTDPNRAAVNRKLFIVGTGQAKRKLNRGSSNRPRHVYSRGFF